jgi:hypothetical protein
VVTFGVSLCTLLSAQSSEPAALLSRQLAAAVRRRHRRFPSGKQPKTKHNAGMVRFVISQGSSNGFVQAHRLFIGAQPVALPNPSVEPTKCSKLHFAAHLELQGLPHLCQTEFHRG